VGARSRKNRARRAGGSRPSPYTGAGGETYTAEQVAAMLAAQRQQPGSELVAKTYGNAVPQQIRVSEDAQGMLPNTPFSPGEPIGPYYGYSRTPRSRDYPAAYNISARPRLHERVSFDVLKGLINSYDIAQLCISHRIASIRSLDYKLIAARGYNRDVEREIEYGEAVLYRPDRKTLFRPWLAKFLRGILSYDAGTLYRIRNRAGRVIGLKILDGLTIAPLLDYWGDIPEPPAPAYVQYVQGLPWNWLTTDDIIYQPFDPQDDSVYGRAPIENILLNANCYSDDTEVLTDRGWLRFAEADISSDRFATRNPETAAFEWQAATRYHEADSGGTMYRAASRNVDLLVTGGHRLLVNRLPAGCPGVRHGSEWLVHAEDLYEYQSALPGRGAAVRCPATSTWNAPDLEYFTLPVSPGDFVRMDGEAVRKARASAGFPACSTGVLHPTIRRAERGDRLRRSSAEAVCGAYGLPRSVIREDSHYFSERIDGDDFAAFMGMYLAEGCVRPKNSNITIAQEESSKGYVEFRDLLARVLGREAPYHRGAFTFGHTALADYLRPLGKAHEKYIPPEVLGMSRRQLEIFWHFYVLGDGHILPEAELVSTCSKRLADGLQEVLQKIGLSASVRPKGKSAKATHHRQWQLTTRRKPAYRVNVERVPYEGKVYCVSVPNKTLYVRRNGYPVWCANTDIRFQLYFLQRFTAGNLPAAFASAPETWTPQQVQAFQEYWDGFMLGQQEGKHQVRWIPGGSKFAWSDEKEFSDHFSLFLLRKTAAAFHVVPADLGLTENVNRSSGESQADVQHRVGDLPLAHHVQDILTAFLQDDLGLPLRFAFDLGEEQDDRVDQANADKIYVDMGAIGVSDIREMRYGLSEPGGRPVPRYIFTERGGPIPLSSLFAVAGEIDQETGAPALGAEMPREVFGGTEGVMPVPPIKVMSLAEREFGPAAMPPAPPPQPTLQAPEATDPQAVAKDGEGAGITAGTGVYSYDLAGRDDGEDEDDEDEGGPARVPAAKAASGYDIGPRSGMISLDIPEGLIEPLPGGVTDFHVTVAYLGPDVDDSALAAALGRARDAAAAVPGPLQGTVSGTGAFPPSDSSDGRVPAWAAVAVPGSEALREALGDLSASQFGNWVPHVTRAYLEAGDPLPPPLPPVDVTFTHLSVHRGDQVYRFPFGGGELAKAADPGPKRPGPPGRAGSWTPGSPATGHPRRPAQPGPLSPPRS
jgi:hypothetical protein